MKKFTIRVIAEKLNKAISQIDEDSWSKFNIEKSIVDFFEENKFFILDENKNVITAKFTEMYNFMENFDFIVKQEHVGYYFISTVFLGVDRSLDENKNVFETIIFDEEEDKRTEVYCDRYAAWTEAEKGHKKAVKWVKNILNSDGKGKIE